MKPLKTLGSAHQSYVILLLASIAFLVSIRLTPLQVEVVGVGVLMGIIHVMLLVQSWKSDNAMSSTVAVMLPALTAVSLALSQPNGLWVMVQFFSTLVLVSSVVLFVIKKIVMRWLYLS